ncbi:MAG: hypothetical protein QXD43_04150 [Candidatus Aenigmatarchaeota archaeon]
MQNNLNIRLDKILLKLAKCTVGAVSKKAATGTELWPFHPDHIKIFFIREWFNRLFYLLKELEKKNYKDEFIASLFKSSSRIINFFWHFDSIKNTTLNKEERIYLFKKLYKFLSIYRKNFEKTLIWDNKKIENINRSTKFVNLKERGGLKRTIFSLEATLFLYTELIWFMYHPLGHTFHGPYKIDNKKLIVRKFFDLKPIDIWSFTKILPFDEIEILEIYGENTKPKVDFMERAVNIRYNDKKNIVGISIKVNDKSLLKEKEIKEIINKLTKTMEGGSKFIQGLNQQDLFMKHIECWFYILKPLSETLKLDWRPPREVCENVYNRWEAIEEIWTKMKKNLEKEINLSRKEKIEELKRHFDPR